MNKIITLKETLVDRINSEQNLSILRKVARMLDNDVIKLKEEISNGHFEFFANKGIMDCAADIFRILDDNDEDGFIKNLYNQNIDFELQPKHIFKNEVTIGNMFDTLKSKLGELNGYDDICLSDDTLRELANIKKPNDQSITRGAFEILLCMLLKGACNNQLNNNGIKGDIYYDNDAIEIKSDGGRISNQLTPNMAPAVTKFNELVENRLGLKNTNYEILTTQLNTVNSINDILNKCVGKEKEILSIFAESIIYPFVESKIATRSDVDEFINFVSELDIIQNGKVIPFGGKLFKNIFGTLDLYMYYKTELFSYLLVANNKGKYVSIPGNTCKTFNSIYNLTKYMKFHNYPKHCSDARSQAVQISPL